MGARPLDGGRCGALAPTSAAAHGMTLQRGDGRSDR